MIKFYSRIKEISERQRLVRAWKEGDESRTEMKNMGYYMLLEGSWESLYVGETKPDGLEVGDEVEIIIQRKI